jgi:hypothetical protein
MRRASSDGTMSRLASPVGALVLLALSSCGHDNAPPATPDNATETDPAQQAPEGMANPPPGSSEEKKSNDASGSSSPMPDDDR